MDGWCVSALLSLVLLLLDESSIAAAYDFQCLTCDNFIDGPGCGEFTRQIPVRACQTFCYFAVVHNRSLSSAASKRDFATIEFTRAIRDCSPYDDMSVEGALLLEPKLGSLSTSPHIDIITIKRCNSEQCNNDFYLRSDEMLFARAASAPFASARLLFVLFLIIFYLKNAF